MKHEGEQRMDDSVFGEIQIILAEKRTAMAAMRTGIAIFALPLSVLSLLVATSRYYQPSRVLHFLLPLLGFCALLAVLGFYLVIQAVRRLRHFDRLIKELKRRYSAIAEFIE